VALRLSVRPQESVFDGKIPPPKTVTVPVEELDDLGCSLVETMKRRALSLNGEGGGPDKHAKGGNVAVS